MKTFAVQFRNGQKVEIAEDTLGWSVASGITGRREDGALLHLGSTDLSYERRAMVIKQAIGKEPTSVMVRGGLVRSIWLGCVKRSNGVTYVLTDSGRFEATSGLDLSPTQMAFVRQIPALEDESTVPSVPSAEVDLSPKLSPNGRKKTVVAQSPSMAPA